MASGFFFPSHFEEKTFSVATWGEKLVHIRAVYQIYKPREFTVYCRAKTGIFHLRGEM